MMKERSRREVLWTAEIGLSMDWGMDGRDFMWGRMQMEER